MEKQDILFSIIVPIYNVEDYVEDCILSVLNQSFKAFELILVDDGSTDNSGFICDKYKKDNDQIRVIHKKNGGLVSARKAGVAIANGKYAVCLDGDDWIAENHLSELYQVITKYAPDIICFDYYEVVDGKCMERKGIFGSGFYSYEDMLKNIYPYAIQTEDGTEFPPTIWAKVYRMELYRTEQLLVDDRIKIGEDAACTIPCVLHANNVYILDKPLYYYRRNNISMTKNRKPFSWDVPELIEKHIRERVKTNILDLQQQISRRTVHALINVVKTQFYREEKYRVIAKDIRKELNREIYINALKDSRFKKGSSISICRKLLLYNFYFPIYLLSKIR